VSDSSRHAAQRGGNADTGIRGLLLAGGIGLLLFAVLGTNLTDDSGQRGAAALPLAVGLATLILAFFWRTPLRAAAGWLWLATAGQAAGLRLIEAGPFVRYQHLAIAELFQEPLRNWALTILLLQTTLVAVTLVRQRSAVAEWFGRHVLRRQVVVGALVLLLLGAAPSRHAPVYALELVLACLFAIIQLGNVGLLVAAIPDTALPALRDRLDGWLGDGSRLLRAVAGVDRFAILAAVWVFAATTALSLFSYERHPHVPDEVTYLYHARYLAAGELEMDPPPVREGFDLDLMTYEADRWYSPVPPGWPAVLAAGSWVGLPWLVNPLLAAIGVVLSYLLVGDLYGRRTARLSILLLSLSPWYLFLGMSFMTHTASFVFAVAAALAVSRSRSRRSMVAAMIGGICLGVVGLIRPLEAVVVGSVLGLWLLWPVGGRIRPALPLGFGLAAVASAALVLPYNRHLTGSATRFPIMAYTDQLYGAGANALGFGPERGLGWTGLDPFPGHGLRDVIVNNALNSFAVNVELLGWSIGSLLLLAAWIVSGKLRRPDVVLLGCIAAVVGIHAFYWFSGGPDFGARYWFLIILPCVVLTARAILSTDSERKLGGRMLGGALALSLMALISFIPWRAMDKYHHYRGMRPGAVAAARKAPTPGGLFLVAGRRHPDYASAAVYNPLNLRANEPIFAWESDSTVRRELLEAYPDRPIYYLEGPTVTGDGYRLVEGDEGTAP
jgi:hypothetical protein